MRKILFIMFSLTFFTLMTGCGGEQQNNSQEEVIEEEDTSTQHEETESTEGESSKEGTVEESNETSQITPNGGLGDSIEIFTQNYGENAGNEERARFRNDYIMPLFMNGFAWNIKVQFETTNQPKRTMKDALNAAKGFIPTDSQKVKEYDEPEMGRKIIEYKSELLKQRFPDSDPPGTFIVIASYGEAGKENEVFSLTIGVGNNP